MIGLSAGRPHPLVVRAMKIARHRRARTLAIVDATLSDVSKLSERTLYYSSNSPAFVRSHTGLLSILQALAYGVYARDTASYDDRIRAFRLKSPARPCWASPTASPPACSISTAC